MKRSMKKILASLAIGFLAVGLSVIAHGAPTGQSVKLSIGKAGTINLAKPAADVLVANPGIADVGSLRSDRLYVVGKTIGDTNVLVFDDEGNQLADVSIQVRADQATLRETVHEFFPNEQVDVRTVNDSVVLQGSVSTPAVANQVRDLVGRFVKSGAQTLVDLMKVQGDQQVMLKVKVIEAKRSLLREYGVHTTLDQTSNGRLNGSFTSTPAFGMAAVSEFGSGTIALAQAGGFGPLSVSFQGLENQGLVNTLAEPTLTAISGETAGFLAGGEFPVPASRDSSGNITVEFKQFGVALNFIPTVLSNDRISLQLTSEVSEKSDVDGVTFGGITVPGLAIRRAQTTIQMGSGGTLMIAGLLKSNTTDALNGYPGLSQIPILGNLFKSKSFQRGESELVFLVTPYIVQPFAEPHGERVAAASPLPSEIVSTSHSVSLSDLHNHSMAPVPASAGSPTYVPSATPAGVPMPVPSVSPAMQLAPPSIRKSEAAPAQTGTQFAQAAPVSVVWDAPKAGVKKVAAKPAVHPQVASKVPSTPPHKIAAAPVIAVEKAALPVKAAEVKPAVVEKPAVKAAPVSAPAKPADVKPEKDAAKAAPIALVPPVKAAAAGKGPAAANAKVQAAADKAPGAAHGNPLSASFMNNLRSVYGNKAPSGMTSGPGVGYIVD